MLETISKGFREARLKLQGRATISEENISDALRDIRMSLIEADVEVNVAKNFLARVKEKAVGEIVTLKAKTKSGTMEVTPYDHFVKICQEELEALMGPVDTGLVYASSGVTVVMLIGLQGSGKTTTCGKLARYMISKDKKKPMLVAADIYRPAAVEQLKVLGKKISVPVFTVPNLRPPQLVQAALYEAKQQKCDVIIIDTAGRLAIDDTLMRELEDIKRIATPQNVFFVCDAMIGQDAVKTAAEFHRRIGMTGFILTKMDGDARGGAALSIKEVTGKPIKFVGMGESMDKLEDFRPQGLASRILGMGDIVGLMKDFSGVIDEKKAEVDAAKMLQGQFNFDDFLQQLGMIKKMGSLQSLFDKMPFFGDMIPEGVKIDDNEMVRVESMINSMTTAERKNPDILTDSRMRRIARGSGHEYKDVKGLVERFYMARQMMGELGKASGLLGRLGGMGGKKGGGFPGFGGGFPGFGGGMPGLGGGMPGLGGMPMMSGLPGGNVMGGGGTPEPRKATPKSEEERRKERNKRKATAKMQKKQRR